MCLSGNVVVPQGRTYGPRVDGGLRVGYEYGARARAQLVSLYFDSCYDCSFRGLACVNSYSLTSFMTRRSCPATYGRVGYHGFIYAMGKASEGTCIVNCLPSSPGGRSYLTCFSVKFCLVNSELKLLGTMRARDLRGTLGLVEIAAG